MVQTNKATRREPLMRTLKAGHLSLEVSYGDRNGVTKRHICGETNPTERFIELAPDMHLSQELEAFLHELHHVAWSGWASNSRKLHEEATAHTAGRLYGWFARCAWPAPTSKLRG